MPAFFCSVSSGDYYGPILPVITHWASFELLFPSRFTGFLELTLLYLPCWYLLISMRPIDSLLTYLVLAWLTALCFRKELLLTACSFLGRAASWKNVWRRGWRLLPPSSPPAQLPSSGYVVSIGLSVPSLDITIFEGLSFVPYYIVIMAIHAPLSPHFLELIIMNEWSSFCYLL